MLKGTASTNAVSKFTCPVCLEIFERPTTIISCGHTFCSKCLDGSMAMKPTCPVCRLNFQPQTRRRSYSIQEDMEATVGSCPDCKAQFRISELRRHAQMCVKKVNRTTGAEARYFQNSVPNRSTFSCPYCPHQNMDHDALLSHVNRNHKKENQQVVCPICASMPWGNPHQRSGNFIDHLNLRHKFEYDTFVDFERCEDDILKDVITKSLVEQ